MLFSDQSEWEHHIQSRFGNQRNKHVPQFIDHIQQFIQTNINNTDSTLPFKHVPDIYLMQVIHFRQYGFNTCICKLTACYISYTYGWKWPEQYCWNASNKQMKMTMVSVTISAIIYGSTTSYNQVTYDAYSTLNVYIPPWNERSAIAEVEVDDKHNAIAMPVTKWSLLVRRVTR